MRLIYTNHALHRALERGISKLPVTLKDAKVEYSADRKTVYSWPNGLCLVVIDSESVVKTCWIKESTKANSLSKDRKAA